MTISGENWQYWTVDFENKRLGVLPRGGEIIWEPLTQESALRNIKQAVFSFDEWWSFIFTKSDALVIAEVWSPVSADPLKGRPSVYLDQMHWRTIADVMAGDTSRIKRKGEIEPAEHLIYLASDGKIVLPLSNGTMSETTVLDRELRQKIGIATVRLSGGWQLRHPLSVRREEIRRAVARQRGIVLDPMPACISLQPYAAMEKKYAKPRKDANYFIECIGAAGVMVDMMIDPEPLPRDAREALENWECVQRDYTRKIAALEDKQSRRALALGAMLMEHSRDVSEAAAEYEIPLRKLALDDIFQHTRMARTFVHWMTSRYMKGAGWKASDLNDIMYLSCASAYADFVVTERSAHSFLRDAAVSVDETPNSYTTIAACVEALDAALASREVAPAGDHLPFPADPPTTSLTGVETTSPAAGE